MRQFSDCGESRLATRRMPLSECPAQGGIGVANTDAARTARRPDERIACTL